MKHDYDALPLELNIARILGARIEGYFQRSPGIPKENDCWCPLSDFVYLQPQMEYRVKPGDEDLLDKARTFVYANFYVINYKGFEFYVPNHGLKLNRVMLPYGFGVMVDADGNELGTVHLIANSYKGEIPESHKAAIELAESGDFVCGVVKDHKKFFRK